MSKPSSTACVLLPFLKNRLAAAAEHRETVTCNPTGEDTSLRLLTCICMFYLFYLLHRLHFIEVILKRCAVENRLTAATNTV